MNIQVTPPVASDWGAIGLNLRPEDSREIEGLIDTPPILVVRHSIDTAHYCRVVSADGEPVVVFGVHKEPGSDDDAVVWLMATPGIRKIRWHFLRESRKQLRALFESGDFTRLHNIADHRNELHIKWLRWLGARFSGPRIREHYQRFEIRR